jgi:hypothetical protein
MDLPGDMTPARPALDMRTNELCRSYTRYLGARPTRLERHAILRAAQLTARAEAAASDINVAVDEVVRIDNAASRARKDLAKVIRDRRQNSPPPSRPKNGAVPELSSTTDLASGTALDRVTKFLEERSIS